jgi:hypothetical protein
VLGQKAHLYRDADGKIILKMQDEETTREFCCLEEAIAAALENKTGPNLHLIAYDREGKFMFEALV